MWLVSASMRILAPLPGPSGGSGRGGTEERAEGGTEAEGSECWQGCPDHLAARFGWMDPPPVSVLAAQLLELGRIHGGEVRRGLQRWKICYAGTAPAWPGRACMATCCGTATSYGPTTLFMPVLLERPAVGLGQPAAWLQTCGCGP